MTSASRLERPRHHRRSAIAVDVDRFAGGGCARRRQNREIAGVRSAACSSWVLTRSTVPVQSSRSTMRRPSTRIRSVSLRVPSKMRPSSPESPTALTPCRLQLFDPHLVQLAAVDHLEDFQRAPIGAPADDDRSRWSQTAADAPALRPRHWSSARRHAPAPARCPSLATPRCPRRPRRHRALCHRRPLLRPFFATHVRATENTENQRTQKNTFRRIPHSRLRCSRTSHRDTERRGQTQRKLFKEFSIAGCAVHLTDFGSKSFGEVCHGGFFENFLCAFSV